MGQTGHVLHGTRFIELVRNGKEDNKNARSRGPHEYETIVECEREMELRTRTRLRNIQW